MSVSGTINAMTESASYSHDAPGNVTDDATHSYMPQYGWVCAHTC